MIWLNERKTARLLTALLLVICLSLGCRAVPTLSDSLSPPEPNFNGLSVHYIDVGQGDCTLICFPDNTSVMIDCGNGAEKSNQAILDALRAKNITELTLILTHPDIDHVGGVRAVVNAVKVKRVFHPYIIDGKSGIDEYYLGMEALEKSGSELIVSAQGKYIGDKDCALLFLSPKYEEQSDSVYLDYNFSELPTDEQSNALSPALYLEYKGVRFLFTGDAGVKQEKKFYTEYISGVFDTIFSGLNAKVSLFDLEFLKVAHHGSDDSSDEEFLANIAPKNAVISVGGNNYYGHPSSFTLDRLLAANPEINIYRTDVCGTLSVFVSEKGESTVRCG